MNPHISAELLAPAGDWDCVRAAVANGADAVYFGLPRFNARLRAPASSSFSSSSSSSCPEDGGGEKDEDEEKDGDFPALPLEVFVHGALCVAYSGQCPTSEALGQRSANRGECAQACRLPYELVVDGAVRDLGDRRYLLSPQDLAAVEEIPALLAAGVISFKIEGRLKTPEYVAAVCQVYRRAIDAALAEREFVPSAADRYQLEMTFSRGLFSGWMHGVNHQELVAARFGKKRGPFAGRLERIGADFVEFAPQVPLRPGDGVVFDTGGETDAEQGGRIYEVRDKRIFSSTDGLISRG